METVNKREARFRRINRIWLTIHLAGAITAGVIGVRQKDWYAFSQAVLALAMLPLLHLLFWALRRRCPGMTLTGDLLLLYRMFVFGTVLIGSAFHGYARIPYWDKLFHTISGALIATAGLMVWRLLTPNQIPPTRCDLPRALLFCQCFNIAVSAVWEFYEYGILVFFGFDAVNHYTTGVHDALQDMLVCALGGLVFLWLAVRYFYQDKHSFLLRVYEHYFAAWAENAPHC